MHQSKTKKFLFIAYLFALVAPSISFGAFKEYTGLKLNGSNEVTSRIALRYHRLFSAYKFQEKAQTFTEYFSSQGFNVPVNDMAVLLYLVVRPKRPDRYDKLLYIKDDRGDTYEVDLDVIKPKSVEEIFDVLRTGNRYKSTRYQLVGIEY